MSIITVIWSGVAGAILTLGIIHFAVWIQNPKAAANLFFSITALSVAGLAPAELGMMHVANAAEWASWVRWIHLPLFGVLVTGILFIRVYLGSGRPWLMWAFIVIRAVILIWNFIVPHSFTFQQVISIRQIPFLGESVSVLGEAMINPWQWIGLASLVLFMLFVVDAAVSLWRKGTEDEKHKATVIGGTIAVTFLLIFVQTQMVYFGLMRLPLVITPAFIIMAGGMAYELGRDIFRASSLAGALHESEERLDLAARSAGLGMWMWNAAENKLWVTDRARALFGIRNDASIGFDQWLTSVHPKDLEFVRRKIKDSLATGSDYEAEYRVRHAAEKSRWIAAHGRPESSENGNQIMRGVVRDITSQKQTHVELDRLRRELAHVGRVTMLGQLTSALAHEIKQPLAAARLNSDVVETLLQSAAPDFKLLRDVAVDISKNVERASQVIDRLSALLKRRSMETRAIPTRELVEDVIALAQSEAVARHITLESTIAPDTPPVRGDRVHLSQVLLNLIINAMDAAEGLPDDRRRIAIEAHPEMDHMLEITVADFGAGIAPDLADKVFEPFFTTKSEGMGMGLAISRTIVDAHGGRLWVANTANLGATFHLLLPLSG